MSKSDYISQKIEKIEHEGVRKNTHAPVSSKNPRRKVSHEMAQAIAYSYYKKLHPNG